MRGSRIAPREMRWLLAAARPTTPLRRRRDRRLRELALYAACRVPYYAGLFARHGLDPRTVRGLDDLPALPFADKAGLRSVPEDDRLARGARGGRLVSHATSGSTGQPFRVYRTPGEQHLVTLLWMGWCRRAGIRPTDRTAALSEPGFRRERTPLRRIAERCGLFRVDLLDAHQPREAAARTIADLAPDLVAGHLGMLAHVAPAFGALPRGGAHPRLAYGGGEMLLPGMRRRIEEGFGARLLQVYGAIEFGLLAGECPRKSGLLHVCEENVVVEILREGRPAAEGETGDVVATALHAWTMPFLRYRTGDLAVRGPSPCPCGHAGATLRSIEGRRVDYFRLPGGRRLHPVAIVGAVIGDELGWVDHHQIVQEREDRVVMRIEPLRPPSAAELARVREGAERLLGATVRFELELVKDLAPTPGEKRHFFRSRLAPPDDPAAGG